MNHCFSKRAKGETRETHYYYKERKEGEGEIKAELEAKPKILSICPYLLVMQ